MPDKIEIKINVRNDSQTEEQPGKDVTIDEIKKSDKITDITQQLQEVEIRSDEVQEIMGFIPHWIIRWGITVIFIVVVVMLIGSWFFKYPDIITASVSLTTKNPPAVLVAHTTGKIEALFITDKQIVNPGDNIAIIENATNYRHLFDLKEKLDAIKPFLVNFEPVPSIQFSASYSLGQLQTPYASFVGSYDDYLHFLELDTNHRKIESIRNQILSYKTLFEQAKRQAAIQEEELKLSKQSFERSESLLKDGIISRTDFESAKSMYLQKQFSYEGAKTALSNSSLQIAQLEQSIMELQLSFSGEKKRLQLALSQAYETLTGQISQWEQSYLLKTPIRGTVTFTKYWSINQNVNVGDRVVTVIPEKGGEIIGKLVLPIEGSGKVKIGQRVNMKFTNYPFMDYGIVSGHIVSRSLVASDNFFLLEIHLDNGLVTSYNKKLEFSQEMQGSAEIVTEDIRLLERFFKPIKNMLDKM